MSADWHDVLSSMPPEAHRAFQPAETLSALAGPWGEVAGTAAGSGRRLLLRLRAFVPGEPPGLLAAAAARARRVRGAGSERLPRIHDVLETPAGLVIVQDRPSGRPIDLWLAEEAPSLEDAALAFADAVAAAAALHAVEVVHGAIEPHAVRVGDDGRAVLHGAVPLPGDRQGPRDARWRAPEVGAGFPATPAADVYALGRLLEQVLAMVPTDAATLAPLRALAARALGPREHRHGDAVQFFRAVLDGLPAPAVGPGPSVGDRAGRSPSPLRGGAIGGAVDPRPGGDQEGAGPPPVPPPAAPARGVLPPAAGPPEGGSTPAPPTAEPGPGALRWVFLGSPSASDGLDVVLDALPGEAPALDHLVAALRRAEMGRRCLAALLVGEVAPGGRKVRVWGVMPPFEQPRAGQSTALIEGRMEEALRGPPRRRPDGVALEVVGYALLEGDGAALPPAPLPLDLPVGLLLHAGAGPSARRFAIFGRPEPGGSLPLPVAGARAATLADASRGESWLPMAASPPRVRPVVTARPPAMQVVRRQPPPPAVPTRRTGLLLALVIASALLLAAAMAVAHRPRPILPREFAAAVEVVEGPPFWRTPPSLAPAGGEVLLTLAFRAGYDSRRWPVEDYRLTLERSGRTEQEVPVEPVDAGVWGFRVDGRDRWWAPGASPLTASIRHRGGAVLWRRVLPFPADPTPRRVEAPARPPAPSRMTFSGRYLGSAGLLLVSRRGGGAAFGDGLILRGAPAGRLQVEVRAGGQSCDGGELSAAGPGAEVTAGVFEAAARCDRLLRGAGGKGEVIVRSPGGSSARAPMVFADDWFDPAMGGDVGRKGGTLLHRVRLRGAFTSREIAVRAGGLSLDRAVLALAGPGWVDEDITPELQRFLVDARAAGADLEGPPSIPVMLEAGSASVTLRLVRADLVDAERLLRERQWRLLCVAVRPDSSGAEVFVDGWGQARAASTCAGPEDFRRVLPARVRVGLRIRGAAPQQAEVAVSQGEAVALECAVGKGGEARCAPRSVGVSGQSWSARLAELLRSDG